MKKSTKVTIIFVILYFMWNFYLQNKLTKVSIEEDILTEKMKEVGIVEDRLRQSLEREGRKTEQILRQLVHLSESGTVSNVSQYIQKPWKQPIPVLVLVCNRAASLRAHLEKLVKYRPSKDQFPIIVSQDCDDTKVSAEVENFGSEIEFIKHPPGVVADMKIPKRHKKLKVYYLISRHYKLALSHIFSNRNFSSVIITEDDLDVAPDFFSYFSNTRYLLEEDRTLWCVSAWNDNGKPDNIDDKATTTLYRSDFLPGLGWMMTRNTWEELEFKWPVAFWDDWMRDPARRNGRQCIRPEISRTGMTEYGRKGASNGMFFKDHLSKIKLNELPVDFTIVDLNYLLPENYEVIMEQAVKTATTVSVDRLISNEWEPEKNQTSAKITYNSKADFIDKAKKLHIMSDFKAGVPRTAYNGIVTCFYNNIRVFLVPDRSVIPNYDPSW